PLSRVTIIVPTHGRPHALSLLLASFRQLTFPMDLMEVIVVGGAADGGREIVRAFAESTELSTTYHVVPDFLLRSASFKRNEGARLARGDLLAFTDDDCVAHPDWIAVAEPLFQTPQVGGVEGAVHIPVPDRHSLTYRRSLRLSFPKGYRTCNMLYR